MKIPENDETIQRVWRWVSQQYARLLLPFVNAPRLRSDEEQDRMVEHLGDWSGDVWNAIERAHGARSFEEEQRVASELVVDASERERLPVFYPDEQYAYRTFKLKLEPADEREIIQEKRRWKLSFRRRNWIRTLPDALEKMHDIILKSYNMAMGLADEDLVDFAITKRHVEKEAAGESELHLDDLPVWSRFDLDPSQWKEYGIPEGVAPEIVAVKLGLLEHGEEDWLGFWRGGAVGTLAVLVNKNQLTPGTHEAYLENREQLKEVTEHEVRHMIQTFASRAKGLKPDTVGLPPLSMRSREYDPGGAYVRTREPSPRQEHALRDIEFHTRLADEARRFKNILRQLPREAHRGAFGAWVGVTPMFQAHTFTERYRDKLPYAPMIVPSHFFEMLKEHQPAKWREAVKQFAKATLGQSADDLLADDRPSQWKSTDPFHFLPEQKDPPKGYFAMGTEHHGDPGPIQGLSEPHVPLLDKEFEALVEYARELNLPGAIKMVMGRPYIPLQVKIRSGEPPYEHERVMPIGKLLRMLKAEVGRTKEGVRTRKGFAPSVNATAMRNLAGVERHIERVQDRLRRMSEPGEAVYRYDTALQKGESRFWISQADADWFGKIADLAGFPDAVTQITPDSGEKAGNDLFYLTPMLRDARGRRQRLGKVLHRMERQSKALAEAFRALHSSKMSEEQLKILLSEMGKRFAEAPKTGDWTLVVSAEPADILSMSTGRGWQSCVTEGRKNFCLLDGAISAWDMIAYAVDKQYDNWLSRVWLRNDGTNKWWPEEQVYQTGRLGEKEFINAVEKYLEDKGIRGKTGQYHPQAKGWSDFKGGSITHMLSGEELERAREEVRPEPYAHWEEWEESDIGGKGRARRPGTFKPATRTYRFFLDRVLAEEEEIQALIANVKSIAGPDAETFEQFSMSKFNSFLATVPDTAVPAILRLEHVGRAVPAKPPAAGIWTVSIRPQVTERMREEHGITMDDVDDLINGRLADKYKLFELKDLFIDAWLDIFHQLSAAGVPYVPPPLHKPFHKKDIEMAKEGLMILRKSPQVTWIEPQVPRMNEAHDVPLSSRDEEYGTKTFSVELRPTDSMLSYFSDKHKGPYAGGFEGLPNVSHMNEVMWDRWEDAVNEAFKYAAREFRKLADSADIIIEKMPESNWAIIANRIMNWTGIVVLAGDAWSEHQLRTHPVVRKVEERKEQHARDSRYLVSVTGPRESRLDLLDSLRIMRPEVAVLDAEHMSQDAVDEFLAEHECCPVVVSVGGEEPEVPAGRSFDLSSKNHEEIEKALLAHLAEPDFTLIMPALPPVTTEALYESDGKLYSVSTLLRLTKGNPVEEMPVEKLTGTLSEDTWGSWPDTGNRFSPQDVLNNPKKYRQEMKKILRADLSYPILMYKDELIDGYHRLAKAFMEKVPTIKVRFITDEQMAAAKKDETQ